MSLHWNEYQFELPPNIEELVAKQRQHGGAIIQYDRIFSIFVYARRTAVFEWVPNRAARYRAGLKNAGWCALLGWWSWTGLIVTGLLIFNNLLGGLDFTRFLTTPPPLPGTFGPDPALRELELIEQKRRYVFLVCLLVVLAFVLVITLRK